MRHTDLIRKSIPNSGGGGGGGGIKSKTITKLFDRFMNRRIDLWNDKKITTTATVSGTVGTGVGRKIRKNCKPGLTCLD